MKKTIKIVTEGKSDSVILKHLLKGKFPNIDFIASNGLSDAIANARFFIEEKSGPFVLVLDTDTMDLVETNKKIFYLNNYLGIKDYNSMIHVVWMYPEFESIFLDNKQLLKKMINRIPTNLEYQLIQKSPKRFIESIVKGGRSSVVKILKDASTLKLLLQNKKIKEITDFINISRDNKVCLSNDNNTAITFNIMSTNGFIAIKKMEITSLLKMKPNDWFQKLMRMDPFLKITYHSDDGGITEYPDFYFHHHVSPYHALPVFEEYILLPRNEELISHGGKVDIKLFCNDNQSEFKVELFYDKTNDVKELLQKSLKKQ